MRSLVIRALIAFFVIAAGSPEARAVPSLLGDANGDGRLTNADFMLLNDMIYARQRIPVSRYRAMDLDGNGFVDIDDLVDLRMIINGDEPIRRREVSTAGSPPQLIPRYAENWWTARDQKLTRALDERFTRLNRLRNDSYDNPNTDYSRELNRTLSDLEHLNYYGALSEGDRRRYCSQIENLRSNWFGSDRETFVSGAGSAEGTSYLRTCAANWSGGDRNYTGPGLSPACTDAAGAEVVYATPFNYSVGRGSNGRLRVRVPIHIDRSELTGATLTEFEQHWTAANACLRDFWARYGVEFVLDEQDTVPPRARRRSSSTTPRAAPTPATCTRTTGPRATTSAR